MDMTIDSAWKPVRLADAEPGDLLAGHFRGRSVLALLGKDNWDLDRFLVVLSHEDPSSVPEGIFLPYEIEVDRDDEAEAGTMFMALRGKTVLKAAPAGMSSDPAAVPWTSREAFTGNVLLGADGTSWLLVSRPYRECGCSEIYVDFGTGEAGNSPVGAVLGGSWQLVAATGTDRETVLARFGR